jgi:hypothetical protein
MSNYTAVFNATANTAPYPTITNSSEKDYPVTTAAS